MFMYMYKLCTIFLHKTFLYSLIFTNFYFNRCVYLVVEFSQNADDM